MLSAAKPQPPAALRPRPSSLADDIRGQMDAIRGKKYAPLGFVSRIGLGVADDSAYFHAQAHDHLKSITKIQGLAFEWDQSCRPMIAEVLQPGGNSNLKQFVFPNLWQQLPDVPDPRYRRLSPLDPPHPKIKQELDYFASGYLFGPERTKYVVLQPVLEIAIQPFGSVATWIILRGRTNPWNGKHPALLVERKRRGHMMAFLIGGKIDFS